MAEIKAFMKTKEIQRAASEFLVTQLDNEVTFERLSDYLKRKGYIVARYTPYEGEPTPEQGNGMFQYSCNHKAFCVVHGNDSKYVFIDDSTDSGEKLLVILHEVGHIYFNHLGDENYQCGNRRMQDIEADAFVYAVLAERERKDIISNDRDNKTKDDKKGCETAFEGNRAEN